MADDFFSCVGSHIDLGIVLVGRGCWLLLLFRMRRRVLFFAGGARRFRLVCRPCLFRLESQTIRVAEGDGGSIVLGLRERGDTKTRRGNPLGAIRPSNSQSAILQNRNTIQIVALLLPH